MGVVVAFVTVDAHTPERCLTSGARGPTCSLLRRVTKLAMNRAPSLDGLAASDCWVSIPWYPEGFRDTRSRNSARHRPSVRSEDGTGRRRPCCRAASPSAVAATGTAARSGAEVAGGPDADGVFAREFDRRDDGIGPGALAVRPLVVDSNVLRDDVLAPSDAGTRPPSRTLQPGGGLRLFCGSHVPAEVEEHLDRWAVKGRVDPVVARAAWRTTTSRSCAASTSRPPCSAPRSAPATTPSRSSTRTTSRPSCCAWSPTRRSSAAMERSSRPCTALAPTPPP
jgi:hypothetical protein